MLYVRAELHVDFMIDESTFYYVFFYVLYILLLYSILKGKLISTNISYFPEKPDFAFELVLA